MVKRYILLLIFVLLLTSCTTEKETNKTEIEHNNLTLEETTPSTPDVSLNKNPLKEKYLSYKDINEDVVAYLSIPDTMLNYPVMQGFEEEYYLRRNIYKKYDDKGLPFLQIGCSLKTDTMIIYGHLTEDGSQFATIHNYLKEEDYRKRNPLIYYTDNTSTYTYIVFAVAVMPIEDNGFVYNQYTNYDSEGEFNTYLTKIRQYQKYDYDVLYPKYHDKILVLSTCYDFNNSPKRVVLFAKQRDY